MQEVLCPDKVCLLNLTLLCPFKGVDIVNSTRVVGPHPPSIPGHRFSFTICAHLAKALASSLCLLPWRT